MRNVCTGCAWDSIINDPSTPEEVMAGVRPVWLMRWWYLVRMLRFGYNVLVIDLDVVLHADFYEYVKSGPFQGMHHIAGDETYDSEINTGELGWALQRMDPSKSHARGYHRQTGCGLTAVLQCFCA